MRIWRISVTAVLLALVLGTAAPTARAAPPAFVDAAGLQVVSSTRLDDRQYDVTLLSDAIGQPLTVRLLLPVGYDDATARYPVLYLYTGTGGSHVDWVERGDAVATTAPHPLITVMPDIGLPGQPGSSFFADWHDPNTQWGPSRWETFQVAQLIPWVDANLRTIASRDGRAVAGLSQGGFGSLLYATRHPDHFTSVASMSGLAVIDTSPAIATLATAFVAGVTATNGVGPDAFFGSRVTDQVNWMGHDPGDLMENLRPLDVRLWTGNGLPGPLDSGPPDGFAMAVEVLGNTMTSAFGQRAAEIGMPITLIDYGPGTHSFPYWARDLRDYLAVLMPRFASPPPAPATVQYQSVDREWTQWGWTVTFQRGNEQELSSLTAASAGGFTLQGTGSATVRTPPVYVPGSSATVTIGGGEPTAGTADGTGSLVLEVPLGGTPTVLVPGVPDTLASAGRAVITIDGTLVGEEAPAGDATGSATTALAAHAGDQGGMLPATGGPAGEPLFATAALAVAVLSRAAGTRRRCAPPTGPTAATARPGRAPES